ncbi:MAG: HAD family hydrolase [candidate division KSB1 bacterium]|nr:HAD family hydrolase [candidate division KSB1 bacterium]
MIPSVKGNTVEAIYIGDRPEDLQAAQAAGIAFVDAEAWRSGKVAIVPGGVIA